MCYFIRIKIEKNVFLTKNRTFFMKFWTKERKDFTAAWVLALSAGSYVGGVMFNILGAGESDRNAIIGFALVVLLYVVGVLLKGGK